MAWRPLSIAAADGCGGGAHTGQIIQAVIKAVAELNLFDPHIRYAGVYRVYL